MRITIIAQAREGSRAWWLGQALAARGHDVSTVNTDSLQKDIKGSRYYIPWENLGYPLPLSKIVPDDQDHVLVIQNMYHYQNDLDRDTTVVSHWFAEPYFAPSVREFQLALFPDRNYEGTMCEFYKWEYLSSVVHEVAFPNACAPIPPELVTPPRDRRGVGFLANIDFGHGLERLSYFESHALDFRKKYWLLATQMNRIITHPYPQPWREYVRRLTSHQFMLCVPGNQCTVNMQITECLTTGVVPIIFVENAEVERAFAAYGLASGTNCFLFRDEPSFMDVMNSAHELELTGRAGVLGGNARHLAATRGYDWLAGILETAHGDARAATDNAREYDRANDTFLESENTNEKPVQACQRAGNDRAGAE